MDRRDFLKSSALLGCALAAGEGLAQAAAPGDAPQSPYQGYKPEGMIFSACQQCNTQCGIKVKIENGNVVKIDGNPLSPWTLTPQIPYKTSMAEAALMDAPLCPKGYAGIQTLYDPYRIVKVLKRAGKRGENKWKAIPFEQAVAEVVEGGDLFGEGKVDGLKDILTCRDPKISDALKKDATEVANKKMTLADFKAKHAENLKYLIDPDHPDFGVKNNQFCLNWGRLKGGRSEFVRRFTEFSGGSYNYHGHTTVCQGSLYFSCKAMSDQFEEGKFTGGSKFYWQADTGNAEFIFFVGANPFEANYGPPLRASKISQLTADGVKIAVADPRCSKTAARAWKWLPVRPEGIGALSQAMIRWIIENKRFDARYLANANQAAAKADKEPTWTQACWLVKLSPEGKPTVFLRGSDLGMEAQKRTTKDGKSEWSFDPFIAISDKGEPVLFDPNDDKAVVEGQVLYSGDLGGIPVKTALQVYADEANSKSFDEWCKLAGVDSADVAEIAREFTSHGKRAVCDLHRGVSQHTSGFQNVVSWMLVNVLIGNHDYMGGLSKATTFTHDGSREGQPFNLTKHPAKMPGWGISIIRHGTSYGKSSLFTGYPAKRVWYPFASDVYQEVIPSAGDMYPYQLKCLLLYMGTPVYSLPAGHALAAILADPKKIPLFITSDITVGETSIYADYVFPDLTYLERWEFVGSHPSMAPKVGAFRQPAAKPMTETCTVYGQQMPINFEALLLGLAEKLKLSGFGDDAFGKGLHLKHQDDMYIRMVANLAFGDKADGTEKLPPASKEDMEVFLKARAHLPPTVFDAKRWEALVGPELWPSVVTILNKGGRFQEYAQAYKDGQLANKYGKMVGIYFDNLFKAKDSITGKPYLPFAGFVPGPLDVAGKPLPDAKDGYDLTLITYKAITQTKSRTAGNYWLQAPYPENFVEVSAADAARMGLKDGDPVRVLSASNPEGVWDLGPLGKKPVVGKVKVLEGLRPGVVSFSLGHGHWAYGAGAWEIDGKKITPDARRGTGIHANAAMRLDPVLKNTGLVDKIGASAVFYQSPVKLVKA
ncbi:MAG: tetrathionate reductase subunit [Desulfovibrionaceae bacterium]|nr:MAG: tetrathionate reductase subunit [Desulfovibrionaceae bacterium]